VPKLRDQQQVQEDDDLLSLSPQPSIVSTVTHGANNNKLVKVGVVRVFRGYRKVLKRYFDKKLLGNANYVHPVGGEK
jgi:hypothetical protein